MSDTLQVSYNNGVSNITTTLSISGNATTPGVITLTGFSGAFSSALADSGTSYATYGTMTLTNSGNTAISSLAADTSPQMAAPFTFKGGTYPGTGGNCGTTLSVGGTCTITLAFTPTSVGSYSDTLRLSYNNGVTTAHSTLSLSGTGTSPAVLSYNVSSYSFGTQNIPSTTNYSITVTNTGGWSASGISVSSMSSPFTSSTNCTSTLSAGSTCSVSVQYAPTSSGTSNGNLTLNYNDGKTAQTTTATISGSAQYINTYVFQPSNGSIKEFTLDPTTGTLTYLTNYTGSGIPSGANAQIIPHPGGRWFYVTGAPGNGANSDLHVFSVNTSTGSIADSIDYASFNNNGGTSSANDYKIDPQGTFFFKVGTTDNTSTGAAYLYVYSINQSTGALSLVSTSNSVSNCGGNYAALSVHPSGRFAYITCGGSNTSNVGGAYFVINRDTGVISSQGTWSSSSSQQQNRMTIHPNGLYGYIWGYNTNTAQVLSLNLSTGAPTLIQSPSMPLTNTRASDIWDDYAPLVHPNGTIVYFSSEYQGNGRYLTQATIDPSTGYLSNISSTDYTAGVANAPRLSPDGLYLYLTDTSSSNVKTTAYSVNASSGALTKVASTSISAATTYSTYGYAFQGVGARFAYQVLNRSNVSKINEYIVNLSNGSLTNTQTFSANPTGDSTQNLGFGVIHPNHQWLYYVDSSTTPYGIAQMTINQSSGNVSSTAATVVPSTYLTTGVTRLFMHPSGRFLYGLGATDHKIEVFSINQITGAVTESSAITVQKSATLDNLAIDPTGRFLVTDYGSNNAYIESYAINQGSGALTFVNGLSYYVYSPVFDPSGSVVLGAKYNAAEILLSVNPATGALTYVSAPSYTSAQVNWGVLNETISPNGLFYYVPLQNTLEYGAISYTTPSLSGDTNTSSTPLASAVIDPSGHYIYSMGITGGALNINYAAIDPAAGTVGTIVTISVSGSASTGTMLFSK